MRAKRKKKICTTESRSHDIQIKNVFHIVSMRVFNWCLHRYFSFDSNDWPIEDVLDDKNDEYLSRSSDAVQRSIAVCETSSEYLNIRLPTARSFATKRRQPNIDSPEAMNFYELWLPPMLCIPPHPQATVGSRLSALWLASHIYKYIAYFLRFRFPIIWLKSNGFEISI